MEKSKKPAPVDLGLRFYTTVQVAEFLGLNPRTIQKWIKEGKLAYHRFGTEYRIEAKDLQAFIEASRNSPGRRAKRKQR